MHSRTNSLSRRNMMQSSAAAVATVAKANALAENNSNENDGAKVILFQGDSITDAGRNKKNQVANDDAALGRGYPRIIAKGLLADHPKRGLQIHNRGISGHKVPDLQKRWQRDCIDLKPDILSILIGVNDIWHKLNGRYDGTVETYNTGYRELLKQTQDALPDTKIVICEPFVLKCGAVNDKWFPEFDQRREVANKIAADMSLTLVPFQKMFDATLDKFEPKHWAGDGVHPTKAGHELMAKTWREVVGI